MHIAKADTNPPSVLDPSLQVSTVLNSDITQPIGIVFIDSSDFLVLEKASGQVKRVVNGVVQLSPVLDLAVNSNSERGLLSMVLHPDFPNNPSVYIRWTESSTGADSTVVSEVPLLLIRPHEVLSGIFHWLVLEKAFNPFRRLCQVSHVVVGGSA
jgi:glucose/arabinose dehydrogenase